MIELATSDDAGLRKLSVEAIARINTAPGRQALLALLKDDDAGVREQAAVVAARRMDDMLYALGPLLRDPVEATRMHAASALARSGDAEALQILIAAVKGNGLEARRAASLFGQAIGRRFPANNEGVKAARRYLEAAKKGRTGKNSMPVSTG